MVEVSRHHTALILSPIILISIVLQVGSSSRCLSIVIIMAQTRLSKIRANVPQ